MSIRTAIGVDWDRAVLWVSAALLALAVIVLVGWQAHIAAAVRIVEGMVPMQYNTALCFGALGLGGFGLVKRWRLPMFGAGLFVAAMGGAVVIEYATGAGFGIDTLFFYPWDQTLSADPGRMALTTAVSFLLDGVALVALAARPGAVGMFGIVNSVSPSLALTSLIGYAFQITFVLPFAFGTQMALHTATALLAYGSALFGYAWTHSPRGPDGLPLWSAGVGVALLPVLLVGAGGVFQEQSWRVVPFELLFALAGVALITAAIRGLTTARVAYKGWLMIAIPLGMLLVFTALVVRVKQQSEVAQRWAMHSTEVIGASQALLAYLAQTESAVRGYVLTRDDSFADSYAKSSVLVERANSHLRRLVADNPLQEARVRRIEQLSQERALRLAETVRLTAAGEQRSPFIGNDGTPGSRLMALVSAEIEGFSQEEERLGRERREDLEAAWLRLNWLLVSGTSAAIMLAIIQTALFSGGLGRRLQRLRDNAQNLAAGRALAPELSGRDEIAQLDRTFHAMARSLDEATRREREDRILEGHTTDALHAEALLKTGALQSAIFNSANFSSIATDAEGVIQIFNVGAERMLGYTAAEVMDQITPADISDPQEVIVRAAALSTELGTTITPGFEALVFKASRGIEDIYELTYIRKDGSRFPAVVSVTALRDAQDAIIGYLLIGTDNTARKEAEEALLQAGALQSAIFNSANFSSIATDAEGVIQIFNVGAERMLGYTAAEVMDQITPADISDPQEVIIRAEALSAELGTTITPGFEALVFKASRGIEDIYELTYFRKDGSRFPAIVSVTALRDPQENIIGYLLIGTDNTARKQVEAAQALLDQRLRDQQFYTRSLIESNIDALMTTDPLGIITDVNQQMILLTGRTRDELIGAPCKNFFTDPDRADTAIKRVLTEDRVSNYELTVRALNGDETVVSYNAATFHNRDRKLQGVFAAARDITERKRFDRTLEEKNLELEHASRMKSEFLATMSHELRTPLNAIIGFSEVLKDGLIGPMTPTQSGYIGDIFTSGEHLLSLINDILDLSKVEAGMMTLELEPVDLKDLLSNSLSIVREKAMAQGVELELEPVEDVGVTQLDMRKTKQIVYNLLSNAVKFSSNGGRVSLRARRVPRSRVGTLEGSWPMHGFALPDNDHQEFLELCVSDSGIGISRENMARLFQAFSQIDSSLARKFEGTGLGLAMIKQLAELHGGTVAVASEEGQGTQFAVWLPLRASGDVPAAVPIGRSSEDPATVDKPSERIALVVEDDDKSAKLVRLLLEAEGFTVVRAESAEIALRMLPQYALSLITLDILLPGIDGWEFLRVLREDVALAGVPVVIIAGAAESHMALARGAAAVLQKPISRIQLKLSLASMNLSPDPQRIHTILVVDDDPEAVEVVAALLPPPAYEVVRAYGGTEAIELARRLRPDLILLDLMMPNVNGFEVAQVLGQSDATASIPILVVSSRQITPLERAMLSGNSDQTVQFVEKTGIRGENFMAKVRRALEPH